MNAGRYAAALSWATRFAMRRYSFLFILFSFLAAPVMAAETPWQSVAPGVSMRLVSAGVVKADGTALLGVELDMPADTKTYWRTPGETGLPTELDFSGSTGIASSQILWPYPQRDHDERYADYVYYGPTLLPIELKLDAATAQIELSIVMGVCSEICVPAQARFSLPVDGLKDMPNGVRIRQAVALAPIPWEDDPQPIGTVEYRADEQALAVWLSAPDIDPESLIAVTADGAALFGVPQKSPEPNLVLIPVLGKTAEIDLESRSVQLTFTTAMGAYEVTRSVETAD